jgi:hypothetical protein
MELVRERRRLWSYGNALSLVASILILKLNATEQKLELQFLSGIGQFASVIIVSMRNFILA